MISFISHFKTLKGSNKVILLFSSSKLILKESLAIFEINFGGKVACHSRLFWLILFLLCYFVTSHTFREFWHPLLLKSWCFLGILSHMIVLEKFGWDQKRNTKIFSITTIFSKTNKCNFWFRNLLFVYIKK